MSDSPAQTEETVSAFLVGSDWGIDVFTAASLLGENGIPANLLPDVEYIACTEVELDEWIADEVEVTNGREDEDESFAVVFTRLGKTMTSTTVHLERQAQNTNLKG